jgi:hypothetical protein
VRVYIDLDGFLLYFPESGVRNPRPGWSGQWLADGAAEFLQYVCEHHEPWWLTSWAPFGRREKIDRYLLPALPPPTSTIPVAPWCEDKSEALPTDPGARWVWFDDDPFHDPSELGSGPEDLIGECRWLRAHDFVRAADFGTVRSPRTALPDSPGPWFVRLDRGRENCRLALAFLEALSVL